MVANKSFSFALVASLTLLISASANAQIETQQPYRPVAATKAGDRTQVQKWFAQYDTVRRAAQMTPNERRQADDLLSRGMSIVTPGPDKIAARNLLTKLVDKYSKAQAAMRALPMIPETQKLHRGYYQYFSTARDLFAAYLAVQDNLFAKDEQGQPIVAQLIERKQKLEELNNFIQGLDQEMRGQFNIPAYRNP
jgi:hypothetical protein